LIVLLRRQRGGASQTKYVVESDDRGYSILKTFIKDPEAEDGC
jgi:hypothetical protein